jgi:type II secretory pathway pseudopilin PulG
MVAMASFAIIGILATLAFITVGWPGTSGRRVIAVVVISIVGFMTSAAAAILAAARDTYPKRRLERDPGDPP